MGYQTILIFAPILIPLLAVACVLIGRHSDEDEKAALALGVVTALATLVAFAMHDTFGGYGMAFSAGLTATALFAYLFYRRREAY